MAHHQRKDRDRIVALTCNPVTVRILASMGLPLLLLFLASPAHTASQFHCTAWGGSHTGRYTFEISTDPCAVRWLEIDRTLEILACNPPVLKAVKPFAPAKGYELHFNLETGIFSDHVPGWADRGSCEPATE